MKLKLVVVALVGLGLSACTSPNLGMDSTPETAKRVAYENLNDAPYNKAEKFTKDQHIVGLSTKNDPKYKSFGPDLDTDEKKSWLNNHMYLLWDRQITKDQFISKGIKKFPSHKYEFTFIANRF